MQQDPPGSDIDIRSNATRNASDSMQVDGAPTTAPPPQPSDELRSWTKDLWEETDKPANWEAACKAAEYCQQTLYPAWYDLRDPSKGRTHQTLRKREDDRRVRVPIAYMNVQQATAMLVPEGTESKWTATEQVRRAEDQQALVAADPTLDRFAQTCGIVLKTYQDEQHYNKLRKGWVRAALSFPIAWMKVYFSRSWADSPIGRSDSGDEQTNMARINAIKQQILDGDIHPGDPDYQELQLLVEGIGGKSELVLQQELVIERLKMEDVVIPDVTLTPEHILRSPWIAQNLWMTVGELRQRYPYQDGDDGTWTGIHPDDLKGMATNDTGSGVADRIKRNPHAVTTGTSQDDEKRVRVREVHSRADNTISLLVEGLPYPAHQWTPKKTPAQWYMFMPLVLNEVEGSAFGISDVELCAETQHRMNRKMSDEEKNRFLAIRRYIRDTSTGDPKETKNITDIPPGSIGGMNLGGMSLEKVLYPLETPYDPRNYDISKDEKFGRMATRLPEQALGAIGGSANFSSEVDVAAQGATIAVKDRQETIKIALEQLDKLCLEVLLQNLCWQDACDAGAGPNAVWPHVYSDQEAKTLHEGIQAEVRMSIAPQVIQAYQTDPSLMVGQDIASRTWEIMEAIDIASAPQIQAQCMERFGVPEPLSREALFKRMQVKVSTSMNADMDRKQRNQDLNNGLAAIAALKASFAQAGTPLDVKPLARRLIGDMSQGDLESIFPSDANGAIKVAAQLIKQEPGSVDKQLLMQVIQMVTQVVGPLTPPAAHGSQPGGPGQAPPSAQPAAPAPAPSAVA